MFATFQDKFANSALARSPKGEMERLLKFQEEETPICVIVNCSSGGKKGERLLASLSRFSHCYMFNVQELWGIEKGECRSDVMDKFLEVLNMDRVRVVAAGGDGTVAFVCGLLDFLYFGNPDSEEDQYSLKKPVPPLAILPIGVGNELSRCIGWSSGFDSTPSPLCCTPSYQDPEWDFIRNVRTGELSSLDLWQINFEPTFCPYYTSGSRSGRYSMLCFFSLGFDANISHKFQLLRETTPSWTSSVAANKWWYTYYGMRELFQPMDTVAPYITLRVDGDLVKLPPSIRTLQFFNIHSSADGVDFFGITKRSTSKELRNYEQPCLHDGLLEVVGTEGVHHLLAIRSRLSHSRRIAQGKEITISLTHPLPIQLDGEAWIQQPSTISISFRRNVSVVLGSGDTRGVVQLAES